MMFDRMTPQALRTWLILAALAYLLLPWDLLPDFIGLPGRIDDLLLMLWLAWFYRSRVQQFVANGSAREPQGRPGQAGSGHDSSARSTKAKPFDAYEVLGISRSASSDEIRDAYRSRMQEYHPDKVAHLGEDLRKLALEKAQEIQRAYRQLHE